jgi:hypothetical protein
MDHGFTAKQSSWILTRLEDGVGGGNLVSLEQLRAAVLPVLQVTLTLQGCYACNRSVAASARSKWIAPHERAYAWRLRVIVCSHNRVRVCVCAPLLGTNFAE